MPKAKLASLVLDFDFYPRKEVDSVHVSHIVSAIKAGATLPPIQVDKKSRRIIDGFHRYKAHERLKLPEIEVEYVTTRDDQHLFSLAIEANSSHGRPYSPFDRQRIRLRAEELGLEMPLVGQLLRVPLEELIGGVKREPITFLTPDGKTKAAKGNLPPNLRNKVLTAAQIEQQDKTIGVRFSVFANELTRAITSGVFDWKNAADVAALTRLYSALKRHTKKLEPARVA